MILKQPLFDQSLFVSESDHPLLKPWEPNALHITEKQTALDFVGDIHGCCDELELLMGKLGYNITWNFEGKVRSPIISSPMGRKVVLLGDLVDRGPRIVDTLRIASTIIANKLGYVVIGNHDLRLLRLLSGHAVQRRSGISDSIEQVFSEENLDIQEVVSFLKSLPSSILFANDGIFASHTGMDALLYWDSQNERHLHAIRGKNFARSDFTCFDTSLFTGENELCEPTSHWVDKYQGGQSVVYGHYQVEDPKWVNNALCIDTGCVYGGKLSALRWPEKEIDSIQSLHVYQVDKGSARPLPFQHACFRTPEENLQER